MWNFITGEQLAVHLFSYFIWSPIIFQDSLHKKDDRIEELEEALRESVQITAEREMVLAQEESARTHAEKQVCTLILTALATCDELISVDIYDLRNIILIENPKVPGGHECTES